MKTLTKTCNRKGGIVLMKTLTKLAILIDLAIYEQQPANPLTFPIGQPNLTHRVVRIHRRFSHLIEIKRNPP